MAWTSGGRSRTGTAQHKRWAKAVHRHYGYQCVDCGYQGTPGAGDVQADHDIPEAEGGPTTLDNGRTRCIPCHKAKTAREAAKGRQRRRKRPGQPHPGDPRAFPAPPQAPDQAKHPRG
ncbi:HNH endonuclease [Rhodococcus sp. 15-2388-1-1a]|uniref:HNH endonuclease n=1 Tax=Nocardiaceae TaxID=85025 RepID=UPI00055FCCB5|nr:MULTISPECIES: HNH endonuclease signature motif containing protein [Rhodococcus]OZF05235.1 HNH endonuclease [Rhodococcus sp. 15-2388-1-1a]